MAERRGEERRGGGGVELTGTHLSKTREKHKEKIEKAKLTNFSFLLKTCAIISKRERGKCVRVRGKRRAMGKKGTCKIMSVWR